MNLAIGTNTATSLFLSLTCTPLSPSLTSPLLPLPLSLPYLLSCLSLSPSLTSPLLPLPLSLPYLLSCLSLSPSLTSSLASPSLPLSVPLLPLSPSSLSPLSLSPSLTSSLPSGDRRTIYQWSSDESVRSDLCASSRVTQKVLRSQRHISLPRR